MTKLKNESTVQDEIRLDSSQYGGLLRNNSGVYNPDDPPTPWTRWGLGNDSKKINEVRKSSDLIGCTAVVITPEMIGHTVAVLTVVEVKKQGWRWSATNKNKAQLNFINWVLSNGGIGCFAQSVFDYRKAIQEFYSRFK